MTADQSSSKSNVHNFLAHRSINLTGSAVEAVDLDPSEVESPQNASRPTAEASSNQESMHESHPLEHTSVEQRLLDALGQRILSSEALPTLLSETVADIRRELHVDRVLIMPLSDRASRPSTSALRTNGRPESNDSDGSDGDSQSGEINPALPVSKRSSSVPIESYCSGCLSAVQYAKNHGSSLSWIVTESDRVAYSQGQIDVVSDIGQVTLLLPQRTWLDALKVKSYINLPIVIHQQLWGLLMVQQCVQHRTWQPSSVAILKRMVQQIAIAAEQATLRQTLKQMNAQNQGERRSLTPSSQALNLQESRSQTAMLSSEEMAPLKQSLRFAELVLEVTERIRDSLDEAQILQTATQELAKALSVDRCKIELYDASLSSATVAYEHALLPPNCIGMTREIAEFPELYQPLFQHQPVQFVVPSSSNLRLVNMTRLACPIFDDQGLLGNLWLFRPRNEMFKRWEVRIIQQIANECAIAIRQARLYEASQKQVRELERLNQLKDDFLKTISHELRTPLSSIILGVQTLERILDQSPKPDHQTLQRLFQTVHMECHRENKLIEDLLTFCYLEAGKEALISTTIDLNTWLVDIVKPFQLRMENQQQQFTVHLSDHLPLLVTELAYLERIVCELLNNACKYTPPHEHIIVSTTLGQRQKHHLKASAEEGDCSDYIVLAVKNSGVEIPEEEQDRIFDKFYRIPTSDPWQYGGTGLGLALVKKLIDCLGASIHVMNMEGYTTFEVLFPVNIPGN